MYIDSTSTLRYTNILQGNLRSALLVCIKSCSQSNGACCAAMVNARLGTEALSLEEQVERGLIKIDMTQDGEPSEAEDGRSTNQNPLYTDMEDGDAANAE